MSPYVAVSPDGAILARIEARSLSAAYLALGVRAGEFVRPEGDQGHRLPLAEAWRLVRAARAKDRVGRVRWRRGM